MLMGFLASYHNEHCIRWSSYMPISSRTPLQAWDLISLCNGMLVGFVAVTAGAHVLEPWAAILCGAVAAFVFEGMCGVLLKLQVRQKRQ